MLLWISCFRYTLTILDCIDSLIVLISVIYHDDLLKDYILWVFSYKYSCLDYQQDMHYLCSFVISEDCFHWSEIVINEET